MNGDSEDLRKEYPRELSLLSENQRLHEEVEAAEGKIRQLREALAKARNYAREEVERLREAVVDYEALAGALRRIAEYDSDEAIFYVDIARAALDESQAMRALMQNEEHFGTRVEELIRKNDALLTRALQAEAKLGKLLDRMELRGIDASDIV